MNHHESMAWVIHHMPDEARLALSKFVEINPHYRGAGWDDCLDVLLDSDSHMDVTEPLHLDGKGSLPAAVAITLLYASRAFAEAPPEHQKIAVTATIENNQERA